MPSRINKRFVHAVRQAVRCAVLAARDPQVQQQQQGIWLTAICVRYPCSDDDRSGDQTYQKATSVPDFVPVVEPGTDWREFRWAGIVAVSPNRVLA